MGAQLVQDRTSLSSRLGAPGRQCGRAVLQAGRSLVPAPPHLPSTQEREGVPSLHSGLEGSPACSVCSRAAQSHGALGWPVSLPGGRGPCCHPGRCVALAQGAPARAG